MGVRLGTNPIAWSNDDMQELGGETPLETCLSDAREAGFQGIELGNKFPREAAPLRKVLDAHDLELVSGWYSCELLTRSVANEIKAIEAHMNLLRDMGCGVLILAETSNAIHGEKMTPIANSPTLDAGDWKEFGQKISDLCDHVTANGLHVGYHHHMGTVVETADEIDAFMSVTRDSVGLLLDTGHATYAGADPLAIAKKYEGRITHFHAKDIRPNVLATARANNRSFLDAVVAGVFTVPGDGCVNFGPIMDVLKSVDYRGWLVVEAEQDPAVANPRKYAEMGYGNLNKFATDAGLV